MENKTVSTEKAWQKIIRDEKEEQYKVCPVSNVDIKTAVCKKITYEEAKSIILEYEWLGSMGQGIHCYGNEA